MDFNSIFRIKGRLVYLNHSEWWSFIDSKTPRDSFSLLYTLIPHIFEHIDLNFLFH